MLRELETQAQTIITGSNKGDFFAVKLRLRDPWSELSVPVADPLPRETWNPKLPSRNRQHIDTQSLTHELPYLARKRITNRTPKPHIRRHRSPHQMTPASIRSDEDQPWPQKACSSRDLNIETPESPQIQENESSRLAVITHRSPLDFRHNHIETPERSSHAKIPLRSTGVFNPRPEKPR